MKLAILMATFNGDRYLKEQIESLLNQEYNNFCVYFSDDGSTDSTLRIINEYCTRYPDKFYNLNNKEKHGSARDNFIYLLKNVNAELYMFCDQDDVWLPNKVKMTIEAYNTIIKKSSNNIPVAVYSDLHVVDSNLNILYQSFEKDCLQFKQNRKNWKFRLLRNDCAGCTLLINLALVKVFKDNYRYINIKNIMMHDHFFILIASLIGIAKYIDEPLILYRQHGDNSVGALNKNLKNENVERINIHKTCLQNNEVLKMNLNLSQKQIRFLNKYIQLDKKSNFYIFAFLIFYRMLFSTIKNNLSFLKKILIG